MTETEISVVSLCCIEEGYDRRKYLRRLTDIENNELAVPVKSDRADNYFENRDRLFLDPYGPSDVGTVGVWNWFASPDKKSPGKDCVKSYYIEDYAPVCVVVLPSTVHSLDDFVHHASTLIEAGDIDSDVLAQIAMNHDELRRQCEEIVSSKWKADHAAEIAKAEQEVKAAEERLSSAEESRNKLTAEIDAAQSRLGQLCAEIERQEALGRDVSAAVRLKIADAQKDMAGFIASLSMFLPQSNAAAIQEKNASCWRYIGASEGRLSSIQHILTTCPY